MVWMLEEGRELPRIVTPVPGPESQALSRRLRAVEAPGITPLEGEGPIFWARACGANVIDVDGNRYIDLTAGFGVANAGHAPMAVIDAFAQQARHLLHGLGDVHPALPKVRLLEKLSEITPGALSQTILCNSGAEAVEAALKTALRHTGRPGVIAFSGSYHGLTHGALDATGWRYFRDPFQARLSRNTTFVPYPDSFRPRLAATPEADLAAILEVVAFHLSDPAAGGVPVGAVLVEPILGRGGIIVPPPAFLPRLRELCTRHGALLVLDEIYTGCGRTGAWFAACASGVTPDLLCVGKGMTGGFPMSACIGNPTVMAAWETDGGEALHTSTFLGHPAGCRMALAQLELLESLIPEVAPLGERLHRGLEALRERFPVIGEVRGRGLMLGIDLVHPGTRDPDAALARCISQKMLERGIIVLSEGPLGQVLALTPPLSITAEQIDCVVETLGEVLAQTTG